MFVNPYNMIAEGLEYSDKDATKFTKENDKTYSNFNLGKALDNPLLKSNPATFIQSEIASTMIDPNKSLVTTDNNLYNINSRDLLSGKGNIGDRFKTMQIGVKNSITTAMDEGSTNQKYNYATSFSTGIKNQKPTAELLEQLILTSGEVMENKKPLPSKDNNYTLSKTGDMYKITYTGKAEGDKAGKIYSVTTDQLPESLSQQVDNRVDDWSKSIYNPNVKFTPYVLKTPQTLEDSQKIIGNLIKFGDFEQSTQKEMVDMDKSVLRPNTYYKEQYVDETTAKTYSKNIDTFLSQGFEVDTKVVNDVLTTSIIFKDIKTGDKKMSPSMQHPYKRKDDVKIKADVFSLINMIKVNQLESLKVK